MGLLLARKLIFGERVEENVIDIIDNKNPEFAPSEILSSSHMAYDNELMERGVFGLLSSLVYFQALEKDWTFNMHLANIFL